MMKRTYRMMIGVTAVITVGSGWAWAGLEGSKHDFSATNDGDKCSACHTPHRSEPAPKAPLWNPQADKGRVFGTSGERRTDAPGKAPQAGAGTLVCLRCHDGTVAPDVIGGLSTGRPINKQHTALFSTAHGSSSHPVGVRYPSVDKEFNAATAVEAKGVPLPDGKVECTSCHDPHNDAGADHLLVMSNARSKLCLTCHKK